MKRLISVVLVVVFATVAACNFPIGNDCGPFKNKFRTLDVSTSLAEAEIDTVESRPVLSPISNDTLRSPLLAIDMQPQIELYDERFRPLSAFQIILAAHACSPPIPSSEEVITGLRITADAPFADGYPAGANLAPLFDAAVYNRADFGYRRFDLPAFLDRTPSAADRIILLLTERPETTRELRFTVEYEQQGPGLETYTFTSEPVVVPSDAP